MISKDVYLIPVLNNAPRLLGLLNRNISSSSYGSFDREYWHYNTVDFSCARKQEAVLTLTLLYQINHKDNKYFGNKEILGFVKAAMMFWVNIQNNNGSFNEWYPNENSFVVTSFSSYAVSESLLIIKDELQDKEYQIVIEALRKAGDWLLSRHETRVMNQQTGAAVTLLNLYLLTKDDRYLNAANEKISLLNKRQSEEGWFLEYGGPDIGYLSLAIDYLSKFYQKTNDNVVENILARALSFIKYYVQPDMVAGGEYTSRNTEYLIPHGFEICSKHNKDALLLASVVRKSLLSNDSFPNLFDDRYFTYVGYTWLQAYIDANPDIDNTAQGNIDRHFIQPVNKYFKEAGLLVLNDENKHFIVNVKKGGSFRLYAKETGRAYSDAGILVKSEDKWYTSGWLAAGEHKIVDDSITVTGNMWKVPDKTLNPVSNILLRIFQMTLGRSSFISQWIKERLRDLLITKTKPSCIRYNRTLTFNPDTSDMIRVEDSIDSDMKTITSVAVFTQDTYIYVPSSRYCVELKDVAYEVNFDMPVNKYKIDWRISPDSGLKIEEG